MSDNQGIQILKNIWEKFKAFLFSKDALIFLFFLLLSFTFWFANALNKNRDANIEIPLRYTGIPQDVVISNKVPTEMKVGVKDEGLNLFAYTRKRILPLNIDIPPASIKSGYMKMTSDQILNRLSHHLRPTTTILNFNPDSIVVTFERLDSVILPIKLISDIELAHQHIFSDSIQINPEHITAYGTKESLDSLKKIYTEPIRFTNLGDSVSITVPLVSTPGVSYSANETEVKINVEMFTEKKVQLPVTFVNVPSKFSIRSFPAFIEVRYNIGLSQYNTPQDKITVFIDYNDIKKSNQEKLKVKVQSHSPKIFNIRTLPEEIEFIIEERNEVNLIPEYENNSNG